MTYTQVERRYDMLPEELLSAPPHVLRLQDGGYTLVHRSPLGDEKYNRVLSIAKAVTKMFTRHHGNADDIMCDFFTLGCNFDYEHGHYLADEMEKIRQQVLEEFPGLKNLKEQLDSGIKTKQLFETIGTLQEMSVDRLPFSRILTFLLGVKIELDRTPRDGVGMAEIFTFLYEIAAQQPNKDCMISLIVMFSVCFWPIYDHPLRVSTVGWLLENLQIPHDPPKTPSKGLRKIDTHWEYKVSCGKRVVEEIVGDSSMNFVLQVIADRNMRCHYYHADVFDKHWGVPHPNNEANAGNTPLARIQEFFKTPNPKDNNQEFEIFKENFLDAVQRYPQIRPPADHPDLTSFRRRSLAGIQWSMTDFKICGVIETSLKLTIFEVFPIRNPAMRLTLLMRKDSSEDRYYMMNGLLMGLDHKNMGAYPVFAYFWLPEVHGSRIHWAIIQGPSGATLRDEIARLRMPSNGMHRLSTAVAHGCMLANSMEYLHSGHLPFDVSPRAFTVRNEVHKYHGTDFPSFPCTISINTVHGEIQDHYYGPGLFESDRFIFGLTLFELLTGSNDPRATSSKKRIRQALGANLDAPEFLLDVTATLLASMMDRQERGRQWTILQAQVALHALYLTLHKDDQDSKSRLASFMHSVDSLTPMRNARPNQHIENRLSPSLNIIKSGVVPTSIGVGEEVPETAVTIGADTLENETLRAQAPENGPVRAVATRCTTIIGTFFRYVAIAFSILASFVLLLIYLAIFASWVSGLVEARRIEVVIGLFALAYVAIALFIFGPFYGVAIYLAFVCLALKYLSGIYPLLLLKYFFACPSLWQCFSRSSIQSSCMRVAKR
jgi:hypothetical protein